MTPDAKNSKHHNCMLPTKIEGKRVKWGGGGGRRGGPERETGGGWKRDIKEKIMTLKRLLAMQT